MGERDTDWERAHLILEGNGVGEGDTDWERARSEERRVGKECLE